MSMVVDCQVRPEDVGEILVKVQDDLLQLKEKLSSNAEIRNLDITALENAIAKTEDGLKGHTGAVLQQLNNRVNTLSSSHAHRNGNHGQAFVETMFDLQATPSKDSFAVRLPDNKAIQRRGTYPGSTILHGNGAHATKVVSQQDFKGLSPGLKYKHNFNQRAIRNPQNPKNRDVLNDNYGIQLPLIVERKPKFILQQTAKGSTIEPLAVIPKDNILNPQLMPPPITKHDALKGILSLMERGLIPAAAELTLEPSPVRHITAPLHEFKEKEAARIPPSLNGGCTDACLDEKSLKLDPNYKENVSQRNASPPKSVSPNKFAASPDFKSRISSGCRTSITKMKTPVTVRTLELQPLDHKSKSLMSDILLGPGRIKPPPTTPASGPDFKDRNHRFSIQNGKTREMSQEFHAFKQHYCLSWGSIVTTLKQLERMLTNYSIPVAFINGDRLADLSIEFELERQPPLKDLLSVIVNREDVDNIIQRPGRRFVGPDGMNCAAARIQATYRMYRERGRYLEFRRKKWAAGVICISWVMNVKMSKVRKQLLATRLDHLDSFRRRAKVFARNWDRISASKRTIIHIPSLGYQQGIRNSIHEFSILQNMQMARLCDIKDPNVNVIFVSPVNINEEMEQYYSKLLGLKDAIDSGNVDDQADHGSRYTILRPEALDAFPSHRMCLASVLKYSPKTLKRIQNLIRGRDAYIVTGVPHIDDVHIAETLGVPVLAPEPDVATLYSTKSGSKRIFASAEVTVPPGEYDVYSLPQLHECLAQLITENLEVTRWLFKLDSEFDGRGIACLDIAESLQCYPWALKEAARYGEKWTKKWAQEAAYIKILAEIPDILIKNSKPVNTKIYPTWQIFLDAFLSQGGIIEACPPSDSITALTVDILIEPTGKVNIVCAGDQIHADTQFSCWGMSVPQSSVEPEQLNDACYKVAEACKSRNVIGHFSVDFVTFIHPRSLQQVLWAVDLNLSYDDSVAMFQLLKFVTNGTLDPKTHSFDVPPPKREEKKLRRKRLKDEKDAPPNTNRYAVMSTRLRHSNLSVVHYSVFFQMCRAHGIGYDIKEKEGTVFALIDSFSRENLGMLSVGDNLQGALTTFARNLSVIHKEISAPNMQGESNFKPVIEDIEAILGITVLNSEEQSIEAGSEAVEKED